MKDRQKPWGDAFYGKHVKQQVGSDDRQLLLFGGNAIGPSLDSASPAAEPPAAPTAPEEPGEQPAQGEPPPSPPEPAEGAPESHGVLSAPPDAECAAALEGVAPEGREIPSWLSNGGRFSATVLENCLDAAGAPPFAVEEPWANIAFDDTPTTPTDPALNVADAPIVTIEEPWANVVDNVEPAAVEADVPELAPEVAPVVAELTATPARSLPAIPHDEPFARVEFLLCAWVQRMRLGLEPRLSPLMDAVNGMAMLAAAAFQRAALPDFERGGKEWAHAPREQLAQTTLDAITAFCAQEPEYTRVAMSQLLLSAGRVAAAIAPERAEHYAAVSKEAAKRDDAARRKREATHDESPKKKGGAK